MPNDPESFAGRLDNLPGSLLGSYGVTAPAASDTVAPVKPASILEQFGVDLPSSKAAAAKAPAGGFYIPWEGRYVATAPEYEKALNESLNPPVQTKEQRTAAVAADLAGRTAERSERTWNAFTRAARSGFDTMQTGGSQIMSGIKGVGTVEGTTNLIKGIGNAPLGLIGVAASPFEFLTSPIKEELTRVTGNRDFGEKAALLVGTPVLRMAAKSMPTVNALNTIVEDIAKGGPVAVGNALKTLRSNPTATPMDISPSVETKAIGIAKGEPSAGQETLFKRAGERTEQAPTLIEQAYNTGMGKTPNVADLLETYKKNAQMVGEALIQPALEKTGPVNLTAVIKGIDEQIGKPALNALRDGRDPPLPLTPIQNRLLHLRQELTYRGKDEHLPTRDQYYMDATGAPSAAAQDAGVHGVQSRLRAEAENLRNSSSAQDRQLGGILGDMRGKLVDAIDTAGGGTAAKPGDYKQSLAAYRGAKEVEESFYKAGEGILSTSKAMENRPEFFNRWVDGLSDHEKVAAQLGARTQIDNYIGTARNSARQGMGIPDAPFVEAKIKKLFGDTEGQKILDTLALEKQKAKVSNNLVSQSITARAMSGKEAVQPREVKSPLESSRDVGNALMLPAIGELASYNIGGPYGLVSSTLAAAGLGRYGYQKIGRAHDIAVNNRYADIASSTEPEMRNALIRALEAKQTQIGGGKKPMNALAVAPQLLLSP